MRLGGSPALVSAVSLFVPFCGYFLGSFLVSRDDPPSGADVGSLDQTQPGISHPGTDVGLGPGVTEISHVDGEQCAQLGAAAVGVDSEVDHAETAARRQSIGRSPDQL